MQLCTRCRTLLPAGAQTCVKDGAPAEAVTALPDGALVGAYRIVRMLGEGGMGFVHEAIHEVLNRRTAIKVLRPEYVSNQDVVKRFLQEARAVNVINHDNIVNVYDFSDGSDGGVYFVMEFLEGETLGDLMHRMKPLPSPVLIHVYTQVLRALAAAHAKQIVHRDLKPVNVFIVPRADNPFFVKLLDFGIAKLRGEGAVGTATVAGTVMGTPQFMSPEQISGKPVDHRSDLFSMGVMLYRAATGQAPFKGEEFKDISREILTENPPAPSKLVPAMPPALERIILRALEKDRERRYATATEMLEDLERLGRDIGVTPEEVARHVGDGSATPGSPTDAPSVGAASLPEFQGVPASAQRTRAMGPAPSPSEAAPRSRMGLAIGIGAAVLVGAGVTVFALTRGGSKSKGAQPSVSASPPPSSGTPVAGATPDAAPAVVANLADLVNAGDWAGTSAAARRQLGDAMGQRGLGEQGQVVTAIDLVGAPALAPLLYQGLEGPPELRRLSARALRSMKLPDAAPKVRAALANSGDKLKVELAATLVALGDADAGAILERALSEPGTRGVAALALTQAGKGSKASEAALRELMANSPAGRDQWRTAAEGLLLLGDAPAKQALAKELAQPDPARAVAAAELLARGGDADARGYLKRVVADTTFARRGEAALALARLGDNAGLGYVADGLGSTDPTQRVLAVATAGRLGQAGQKQALAVVALVNDPDRQVRLAVLAALVAFE